MSFALTTAQVRARTKTVTRRLGWANAKVGDLVQPVVKGQGLKKGERVEKIGGPVRFVSVRREPLNRGLTFDECVREGFPGMGPSEFVDMFRRNNGCQRDTEVTRIEFEYLEPLDNEAIHGWFELSYAQYLTIPRSVLQSMPPEWQRRFVACLKELDETIDWRPDDNQQYRVTLHRPNYDYQGDNERKYWGPDLPDPLMDYERGRRRVPHRTETV